MVLAPVNSALVEVTPDGKGTFSEMLPSPGNVYVAPATDWETVAPFAAFWFWACPLSAMVPNVPDPLGLNSNNAFLRSALLPVGKSIRPVQYDAVKLAFVGAEPAGIAMKVLFGPSLSELLPTKTPCPTAP